MRRIPWLFFLILALCLLAPNLALADDTHKAADNSPFSPVQVDLGIWTLVVFLILFFVLKKYAWGPMLQGLRAREETIHAAVEAAERARAETERAKADFDKQMAEAQQQIPRLMDEARKDAERMINEMKTKAAAEINADRDRLRREIDTATQQALSELWSQTANLATLISSKAIKRSLAEADHRRLVDEALTELKVEGDKIVQETANLRR